MKILVAGAGGAIGGHLVKALLDEGHEVRAVDIKPKSEWWQAHVGSQNWSRTDLSNPKNAHLATSGADYVYDLAERMGGISFITNNRVECAESIEIGIALLRAAAANNVERFFFSSSACVYPTTLQSDASHTPALREEEAWPAQPEDGYGFAKLYMEELCRHYTNATGMLTRVARYHNVYGPPCSWNDGKEKSPAAICRKVAEAVLYDDHKITIWGDGEQVRSYMHMDDCVRGTIGLMHSNYEEPMNLGSNRSITINEMVSIVEKVAGVELERHYDLSAPQGVAGRNADITVAWQELKWEPKVTLEGGLTDLYDWITTALAASNAGISPGAPTSGGSPSPQP